jgi:hypothetical protein
VVFALCNMSDTVAPVGWNDWSHREYHRYVLTYVDA